MKYRMVRFSAGGVPTTGGAYDPPVPQYPFPSQGGDTGPTTNMTVSMGGKELEVNKQVNPFKNPNAEASQDQESPNPVKMRKGGRVKRKSDMGHMSNADHVKKHYAVGGYMHHSDHAKKMCGGGYMKGKK